jgi:hypothetical protein
MLFEIKILALEIQDGSVKLDSLNLDLWPLG